MGVTFINFLNGVEAIKSTLSYEHSHLYVSISPDTEKEERIASAPLLLSYNETQYPGYHWTIPDQLHLQFPYLDKITKTWTEYEQLATKTKWISAAVSLISFIVYFIPRQSNLRRLALTTAGVCSGLFYFFASRRASHFAWRKIRVEMDIREQRSKIERFRGKAYEDLLSIFDEMNHPLIEQWTNHHKNTTERYYTSIMNLKQSDSSYHHHDAWVDLFTDAELKMAFSEGKKKSCFTDTINPSPVLIRTFLKTLFNFKSSLENPNLSRFNPAKDKLRGLFETYNTFSIKGMYLALLLQTFNDFDTVFSSTIGNQISFECASALLWATLLEADETLLKSSEKWTDELYENLFLLLIFSYQDTLTNENYLKYFANATFDPSIKAKIEKLHNGFFKEPSTN